MNSAKRPRSIWTWERAIPTSLLALSLILGILDAGGVGPLPTDLTTRAVQAAAPRVLPPGKTPDDSRLGPLKDLDGYFPFTPSSSLEDWNKRAERVRRQVLVALGLWPMPIPAPLNAIVHGMVERDDFTVERVYFESYPGHFVTGSLFRPRSKTGKLPGVLCPHGHWKDGRFYDAGRDAVRRQLVEGAERFEEAGRYPLQARCVQLARMGCVVFHYDMLGNADSQQISLAIAHGFAKQRPHMNNPQGWGFFSAQAELRQQNIMGLQTYNSIRALDFLSQLPDVDPERIGVTGASGGGTQTFILCAVDPRPAVAFPAVMVSTAMQGGCTCENASNLRVNTGNVELAALFAPKPLGMAAADDWTREIMTKGYPDLKQHYGLYGAAEKVTAKALLHFPHNYNYVSRALMYQWFNQHLKLGWEEPVVEEDFRPLSVAELTVWDDQHPRPPAGEEYERSLLRVMTANHEKQIAALHPVDAASLAKYRQTVGGGVDVLIGREIPPAGAIEYEMAEKTDRGDYLEFKALLRNKAQHEELPALFFHPKAWNRRVVIWVHEQGKEGLFDAGGSLLPEVRRLLAAGTSVAALDLLYQGEFLADGKPLAAARRVPNPREFLGYTLGYNHSLFAQRVHDILSMASFCRHYEKHQAERVDLAALGNAGPWAAAAVAQARGQIDRAAIDTAGFRFAKIAEIGDLSFLAGGAQYDDLPGMLALAAPTPLWLAGEEGGVPTVTEAAYQAAGASGQITPYRGPESQKAAAAIEWLLK